MRRVQVFLGDEELAFLDRAVRQTYGSASTKDRLQALQDTAGTWSDRPFTGAQHVDAIRGDLNERLRMLGME